MHRYLCTAFLLLISFPCLLLAQEHTITSFNNLPARLFFFDDTTSAIYHDAIDGDIYVSPDEGKGWKLAARADGIPKGVAAMVIEHPFDSSYAFVLTRGTTHYRTEDRGKSWRPFEVPIPPALVAKPLAFHSDLEKYGYVLYQGTVCDKSGWGAVCHDETYLTKDAFSSKPHQILSETSECRFAHSSADFKHDAHSDLVYCVAFDTKTTNGGHSLASSRLFSSTDFFENDKKVEELGHQQWYKCRKTDVDCYVGEKFTDLVEHEDPCPCTDEDYECDYNYVRHGDQCVPVGPEPIPAGVCKIPDQTYMGSSGYRKIPGNTCIGGTKDEQVAKPCSQAQPAEGAVIHQTFPFPARVVQNAYFSESTTILVLLEDHTIWQSSNEGYTWIQKYPEEHFMGFYHHKYSSGRAYLLTNTEKFYTTTDSGRTWNQQTAPSPPNSFRAQVLRFHTDSDKIIWIGNKDCHGGQQNCHAEAQYSRDNGRQWTYVEKYVVNCVWGKDAKLDADPTEILCESYRDKRGDQRLFQGENPLSLVEGSSYFSKKTKLFENVVSFAKFSEFLVVAQLLPEKRSLDLQVSLDGVRFATGMFPPNMHPETHAYTVLESSIGSLFLHMTMSEYPSPYWGSILKSNSNGTYFGLSIENVNRNEKGFVDFEKMIGLDGIALINVVSNTQEALITGRKSLQSRITHNDGGSWKPLTPPLIDSQGNKYECSSTKCALHVHGYTERRDPRATYSSSSIVGLIIAVGNVGETLAPYEQCDTFLSRDAGITWEEVHKDAHLWKFGDSGSILVMANDEEPTDHVLFSTDEGMNWRSYKFSEEKLRVLSILTVPMDTSRRFILIARAAHATTDIAVHLDFTALTWKQCMDVLSCGLDGDTDGRNDIGVLSIDNPGHDDFELWSPSEEHQEQCLFGRQTLYHRRVRDRNCVVGDQPKATERIERNCICTPADFECEFNHYKEDGKCVLYPGAQPLANENTCGNGADYWYERTAYRKISYSSCAAGERLDRGPRHECLDFSGHSGFLHEGLSKAFMV
ncbi:hypothetical protein C8J57DRAFT_1475371 [Mycena rebaudengoi]|nr:hypothetical protein C8J57DRAFT_1475371 [Mycena rebaudengoi]